MNPSSQHLRGSIFLASLAAFHFQQNQKAAVVSSPHWLREEDTDKQEVPASLANA